MRFREFVLSAFVRGVLIVAPIYVVLLLLLKAANSIISIVRPAAKLFPEWLPAGKLLSLLLVLLILFLVGLLVRTRIGEAARDALEKSLLDKLPGYTSIRSLTARLAGESCDSGWKPALVEIEEALVPAFIIEEHVDGRFTAFVPSVPTPFAGSVYILDGHRVHPVNVPFSHTFRIISQWGAGSKELLAAIEKPPERPSADFPEKQRDSKAEA